MDSPALLSGTIVIELASVLAGPSVGMFLAELGATVIKIEHFQQGGDVTRSWKLKSEDSHEDISAYFSSVNWGKQSVGIDLRAAEGQHLVHQLVKQADIVLASYKPGDAAKLNMDAENLQALKPDLIYAEINAYGRLDDRAGYDAVIQAETGFTFMNGMPDSDPVKMPVALIDVLAAHHLKEGILLALLRRDRTGAGAYISAPLVQAGMASLVNQAANWLVAGKIPLRIGSDHPNIVPYGTLFLTQDRKYIVLAVGSDGQFRKLCKVIGIPDAADQPQFRTNPDRVKYRETLKAMIQERIQLMMRDPLLDALAKEKVPAGAVKNMEEVFSSAEAADMLLEHGGLRGVRSLGLEGWDTEKNLTPPPHLCGDTESVLGKMLGLSEAEIALLKENQIIG